MENSEVSKNYRAFFLVPPEVQLLDITGPAHLFYEAREYGANLSLHYLRMAHRTEEISSAGLALGELVPFQNHTLTTRDVLIIPGMESHIFLASDFRERSNTFFKWLQEQHENGARICSVCTGAYLLAFSGLMEGKQCTTHWKYISDFTRRFPKVMVLQNRLLIRDGNLYSSAGVSSGIDLGLLLLEELFGPVFAAKIAKEVVIYFRRTENDPQLSVFLQYRNHIETRIHQAQDYLIQHLDQKTNIESLAEIVHMSSRNLTRLFKRTTGITIGCYVDKLRLEKATQLLTTGEKVQAVAKACGLQSTNQLRTLLRKNKAPLPSEF
ncbi:MAG: helix-turn-helix domain-containing protein [Bacteroidota bacterium]